MPFIIKEDVIEFEDLERILDLSQTHDYLSEVYNFLMEWFDASSTISVQTSGSTGTPKSISLSKSAMIASAHKTGHYFGFEKNTKALLGLSAKYIAGKMMIVRALVYDFELILVEPSSNPLKDADRGIDFVPLTPHQLMIAWSESPDKFNKVGQVLLGGSPVNNTHKSIIKKLSSHVYQGFGMTETITHIAVKSLSDGDDHYQPLHGVSVSSDDMGRMVISADHLDVIVTNDLVDINQDNAFCWLGRLDNIINTGGVKVYPEVIENKLQEHMSEYLFFIHKEEDTILGEKVVMMIESEVDEITLDLATVFNDVLEKYERPRHSYIMKSFVFTETGKINRKATFANK